MTIRMVLPIIPKAQMRARSTVRKGARFASVYKAPEQRAHEQSLIALIEKYRPEKPIEGPVSLSVTAYMPIPQSWPKKRKLAAVEGIVWHIVKPDGDNILKQVKDCMTQLSFWHDDCQAASSSVDKIYSVNPGWVIELETLE